MVKEVEKVLLEDLDPSQRPFDRGAKRSDGREGQRYHVFLQDDDKFLISQNAPNVWLRVVKGLSIKESELRRYPERTIFLDGVFTGAPFIDNENRRYSFDHHAGCVRSFTLATCEQTAIMLLKGLPLAVGEWTIYVNEPDLDSILAAWVLLNHSELLQNDQEYLKIAMPLIRVEGVIDAHGLDKDILTAFPHELYAATKATIDSLISRELNLKSAGQWNTIEYITYTRDMLEELDRLVFYEDYRNELLDYEQISRLSLDGSKQAFLCRSSKGIYAVEEHLKSRYGKNVGLIILDMYNGRYTLRQVDPFMNKDLRYLYKALNRDDPTVQKSGGGDQWGGSNDIGGSPRKSGSGLSGYEILDIAYEVYRPKTGWFNRLLKR